MGLGPHLGRVLLRGRDTRSTETKICLPGEVCISALVKEFYESFTSITYLEDVVCGVGSRSTYARMHMVDGINIRKTEREIDSVGGFVTTCTCTYTQ